MSNNHRDHQEIPGRTLFREDASVPQPASHPSEPQIARARRARGSALWAAYGDALGFISELTDEAGLLRRTQGEQLRVPIAWRRRIGGRSGTMALLPAGCYSDDTQLRLCTSRAIGPHGFDVEAFAKVELPVWPAYALGGGLASKKAAANLAKPTTSWFANGYSGWTDSGGNGAAMRIQPHVWSAATPEEPSSYLLGVLRNSVCTHGHPVALLGAVLHASSLATVMSRGSIPSGSRLLGLIGEAEVVPSLLRADPELAELWLGNWERASRSSFDQAWDQTVAEARKAAIAAEGAVGKGGPQGYLAVINELRLLDPARRGSGTLTSIASVALLWCESRPAEALAIAANVVGSDTDTIATMAGAIVGVTSAVDPPVEVLDAGLIVAEAERMTALAFGGSAAGHRYPDLLSWSAPRTQADALFTGSDGLQVVGLGTVERTLGEPLRANQGEFSWQWAQLRSGQTLLIKRRSKLPTVHQRTEQFGQNDGDVGHPGEGSGVTLALGGTSPPLQGRPSASKRATSPDDGRPMPDDGRPTDHPRRPLELDRVLSYLDREGMSDAAIGYTVRRVAREGSTEQIAAVLAAILDRLRR